MFRDSGIGGVRLRITDMQQAPQVARELAPRAAAISCMRRDWSRNNRTWFAAVQTEKRMMFLILTLIVAVAAFNLLSSLVMAVKDKQSDIAILRTLGASPREVARIFVVQGRADRRRSAPCWAWRGVLVAYNIDIIVPFIERLLGVQFLPQANLLHHRTAFRPASLPTSSSMAVTSLVLSLLATLYPSWRASRLQPAEVLRHD